MSKTYRKGQSAAMSFSPLEGSTSTSSVIPAQAGISLKIWGIPAFAGMTV
jgi:hypothetical protein